MKKVEYNQLGLFNTKWQKGVPLNFSKSPGEHLTWIGALSFEERCLGSIYTSLSSHLKSLLLINYSTKLSSIEQGEKLRMKHKNRLIKHLEFSNPNLLLTEKTVNAYSRSLLLKILDGFLQKLLENDPNQLISVVIDISCLTKIHTIYSILWCLNNPKVINTYILYTRPQTYGSPKQTHGGPSAGWIHTIINPLKISKKPITTEFNIPITYCIYLMGHEGDRARAALFNLPIDILYGIFVLSPNEPRLEERCRIENEDIIRDIERKKVLGAKIIECEIMDNDFLLQTLENNLSKINDMNSLIYFLPLGPKPLILTSVLAFWKFASVDVEVVYPIPVVYDINYTYGIREVFSIKIK